MVVICLLFDQSFLMLNEPIPIDLVKFIHFVADFLHRLDFPAWIALSDDVMLMDELKKQQISFISELFKADVFVVPDELQMRQLFVMNPSDLAILSAQVDLALLYYLADKGPELVLLVQNGTDDLFIASADLHLLSVQPI